MILLVIFKWYLVLDFVVLNRVVDLEIELSLSYKVIVIVFCGWLLKWLKSRCLLFMFRVELYLDLVIERCILELRIVLLLCLELLRVV